MKPIKHILIASILVVISLLTTSKASADLIGDSRRALQQLVAQNPAAAKCKSTAVAVLVFPDVVKAGFILGAQGGQGILFVHTDNPGVATVP
jgi:lipid-binding SYLF domain-containing protein